VTVSLVHRRLPLAEDTRPRDLCQPVYAVWEVTLRCDLFCHHCGSRSGKGRPDELTTAEALDLVAQMADLGVLELTLIGGEAYLRDDWTEIVRAAHAAGIRCSMTTGGRGVTAAVARAAREAGLESASVSVDGLADVHDALRGLRGSYDAALAAIANFRAAGVPVGANTQVSRPGLRQMPDLFERLIAAGIHGWQVQLTVAMGRAADTPEVLIEPYQMLEVLPMLARLKARADAAGVRLWPGNNIGYFGPYEARLRGKYPGGHGVSCGAGRTTLGIEANGDIKGCPSLPTSEYVGGNVREHRLRDIWERSSPLRYTRDRTVEDLWGPCRTCYYADECRGGCTWTAHSLLGRPGNNPYCHHRALELLRQGLRERVVQVEAAPGHPFDHGRFEIVVEPFPEATLSRAQDLARTGEGWLDSP
jgi:radical SAM protein with 4Fe4S-binding SPASM domain